MILGNPTGRGPNFGQNEAESRAAQIFSLLHSALSRFRNFPPPSAHGRFWASRRRRDWSVWMSDAFGRDFGKSDGAWPNFGQKKRMILARFRPFSASARLRSLPTSSVLDCCRSSLPRRDWSLCQDYNDVGRGFLKIQQSHGSNFGQKEAASRAAYVIFSDPFRPRLVPSSSAIFHQIPPWVARCLDWPVCLDGDVGGGIAGNPSGPVPIP